MYQENLESGTSRRVRGKREGANGATEFFEWKDHGGKPRGLPKDDSGNGQGGAETQETGAQPGVVAETGAQPGVVADTPAAGQEANSKEASSAYGYPETATAWNEGDWAAGSWKDDSGGAENSEDVWKNYESTQETPADPWQKPELVETTESFRQPHTHSQAEQIWGDRVREADLPSSPGAPMATNIRNFKHVALIIQGPLAKAASQD